MRNACNALAILLCCTTVAMASPRLPGAPRVPYAPGEILVAFAPGAGVSTPAAGRPGAGNTALAATMARLGLVRADVLAPAVSPDHGDIVRLRSDQPDFDPVRAAQAMRSQPGVIGASPNLHLTLHLAPNDPYLPDQWHLGNSAAAIHAQQGWARQTGSASVLIAIIDTGVDLTHSDLYSNIWINPGEIAGNSRDDDHNGYQDDVNGWDFGNADNDANPEPLFDPYYNIDEGWHGTFVAGLAGAAGNNGVGIAGVAWNCKLLPLKISDMNGDILLSSAVQAIGYATARHASVINLSFGTSDPSAAGILQPAINAAAAGGAVCVASAGNAGTDQAQYPAACDSVLAVASTSMSNVRSSWSNWGWYVDMAAPGEAMWSCISRNYAYDDYSALAFEQWWGFDGMHAYMQNDGTSFAAPLVSGAVALVRSQFPFLSVQQVLKQMVLDGEFKLFDNPIGPKLDLDRSLTYALAVDLRPVAEAAGGVAFAPPSPNPAPARSTLRFALTQPGRARLAVYDAAGRQVRVLADGAFGAGEQAIAWDLRGDAGGPVNAGLYFARLEAAGTRLTRRVAVVR